MSERDSDALLLFDGTCGFCAASVQFILKHERRHTLRFAPLQSESGAAVLARHPELAGVDSMVWVEQFGDRARERVTVRASAALAAARYVGGIWRLAALAGVLPARWRDTAYDLLARHRHRLTRQPGQCYVPPLDLRSRFLT
jgi:predicted DCC family thiol-disulfide oxidoreductase YuxK